MPLAHPAFCIWGANTGVGKTLVSAGLARAAVSAQRHLLYIKPVQTGYPQDSDAGLVERVCRAAHGTGSHPAGWQAPASSAKVLFTYGRAVGPHLAAAEEGRVVPDADIVAAVRHELRGFAGQMPSSGAGLCLVETAGGVASPGPSGTLQGDLMRPLRLPAVLVGDPHLGGISTTIAAYEALLLRGYEVAAVAMVRDGLDNYSAVANHLSRAAPHRMGRQLPVVALPPCLPAEAGAGDNGLDANLAAWLEESAGAFRELLQQLVQAHEARLERLRGAAASASANVWWPFTQHTNVSDSAVTVVDARAGEEWAVFKEDAGELALVQQFDACSSWWTQTVGGDLQTEMARTVGAAAARYMHVMWPENAHEPGLELTAALLRSPLGAGWATRAFYSDDGSTAVEVAIKMAFRKYMADHGLLDGEEGWPALGSQEEQAAQQQQESQQQQGPQQHAKQQEGVQQSKQRQRPLHVLALHNNYHGDTLGAMDCAASSPFNGRLQTPWYTERGLYLEPPYLSLSKGRWHVQLPPWLQEQWQKAALHRSKAGHKHHHQDALSWANRESAFCPERNKSQLARLYASAIAAAVDAHETSTGAALGALLLEPVLQGAGGMLCVDPCFQRELVQECRKRRIPVMYDEVFTGCWRLGYPTGGAVLGMAPDIACYAKLLTGGVAPLAVTLSTEDVFAAFQGPSKVQALLHGHSYTAYPVGCSASVASLHILQNPELNPNTCCPERCGLPECKVPCGRLLPQWDDAAVAALSHHSMVNHIVVVGSVLAVEVAAKNKATGSLESNASSCDSGSGSGTASKSGTAGSSGTASSSSSDDSSSSSSSDDSSSSDEETITSSSKSSGSSNGSSSGGETTGYMAGGVSAEVIRRLRERGVYARPLGAVVYLMVPPTTAKARCDELLAKLHAVLDECSIIAEWEDTSTLTLP